MSELEHQYSIIRWLPSDSKYKELQYSLLVEKKDRLLLELWMVAQQRLFLLKLKKKYAGTCVRILHKYEKSCSNVKIDEDLLLNSVMNTDYYVSSLKF